MWVCCMQGNGRWLPMDFGFWGGDPSRWLFGFLWYFCFLVYLILRGGCRVAYMFWWLMWLLCVGSWLVCDGGYPWGWWDLWHAMSHRYRFRCFGISAPSDVKSPAPKRSCVWSKFVACSDRNGALKKMFEIGRPLCRLGSKIFLLWQWCVFTIYASLGVNFLLTSQTVDGITPMTWCMYMCVYVCVCMRDQGVHRSPAGLSFHALKRYNPDYSLRVSKCSVFLRIVGTCIFQYV